MAFLYAVAGTALPAYATAVSVRDMGYADSKLSTLMVGSRRT